MRQTGGFLLLNGFVSGDTVPRNVQQFAIPPRLCMLPQLPPSALDDEPLGLEESIGDDGGGGGGSTSAGAAGISSGLRAASHGSPTMNMDSIDSGDGGNGGSGNDQTTAVTSRPPSSDPSATGYNKLEEGSIMTAMGAAEVSGRVADAMWTRGGAKVSGGGVGGGGGGGDGGGSGAGGGGKLSDRSVVRGSCRTPALFDNFHL